MTKTNGYLRSRLRTRALSRSHLSLFFQAFIRRGYFTQIFCWSNSESELLEKGQMYMEASFILKEFFGRQKKTVQVEL